ncbi:MAG: VCBS repeat-containing protein [Paludibaculum sp.]
MHAADLNGDGRPDLVVGYVNAPGVIYYNDGTGRRFEAQPFGDGKGAIYGMASGDLNGDGRPDLVAARSEAPSFVVFPRRAK